MKKLLFIFFTGILLLLQEANAIPAEATFTASPHERILVFLNNRLVNHTPTKQVRVRSRPGKYMVQIRVYNLRGRLKFVHTDNILLHPKSHNQFLLEVHPFKGSRLISLTPPLQYRVPETRMAPPVPAHPRMNILEDEEFSHLIFTLEKITGDRVKMEVAKDVLRGHYVYSEDVKEIMLLLAHEANRLDFSKFAFKKVADPEHFEVVFEALRYDSSVLQLRDFLSRVY